MEGRVNRSDPLVRLREHLPPAVSRLDTLDVRSSWTCHNGIVYVGADAQPTSSPPTKADITRWRKRNRTCSSCGQPGHNMRRCPDPMF